MAARARAGASRSIVARFLSPQASFAIAAAIQSLIVMVIPAGVAVPAPRRRRRRRCRGAPGDGAHPAQPAARRAARRRGRVRARSTAPSATLSQALRRGDRLRAERGLEKARALQPLVDDWRTSLDSGARDRAHLAVPAPAALRARSGTSASASRWTSRPATSASSRAGSSTSATTAWPGRSRPTCSPTSRARADAHRPFARRHLARADRAREPARGRGAPRPAHAAARCVARRPEPHRRACGRSPSTCSTATGMTSRRGAGLRAADLRRPLTSRGATAPTARVSSPSRQRARCLHRPPGRPQRRRARVSHRCTGPNGDTPAARSHSSSSAARKRVHALAGDVAVDERLRQSLGGDRRMLEAGEPQRDA